MSQARRELWVIIATMIVTTAIITIGLASIWYTAFDKVDKLSTNIADLEGRIEELETRFILKYTELISLYNEMKRDLKTAVSLIKTNVTVRERDASKYLELKHEVTRVYDKRVLTITIVNKVNETRGVVLMVFFADAKGGMVSYHQDLIAIYEKEIVVLDVPRNAKQYLIVLVDSKNVAIPLFTRGTIAE